jgi:hypothetical protein
MSELKEDGGASDLKISEKQKILRKSLFLDNVIKSEDRRSKLVVTTLSQDSILDSHNNSQSRSPNMTIPDYAVEVSASPASKLFNKHALSIETSVKMMKIEADFTLPNSGR